MQAIRIKKITFLLLFFFALSQVLMAQGVSSLLKSADSLFNQGRYQDAVAIYEKARLRLPAVSPTILLKMAFAYEKLDNFPVALYYLDQYYQQEPSEKVVKKMSEIARANGYLGYELNDFNFIVLIFKQYSVYVFVLMLSVAIYIFSILFVKRLKLQYSPFRHHMMFLFFLLGCALLINLPDSYQSGIIKHNGVMLRADPSAASEVKHIIDSGHRLSVIGNDDIWIRVLWENELYYLKRNDIMLTQ